MASETFPGYGITSIGGRSATSETTENAVEWRPAGSSHRYKQVRIDSTAVDTGDPTSLLRPGLLLGELDNGAGWVDYDTDATDGSQQAKGVLVEEVDLFDPIARASADRTWRVLIQGGVIASRLYGLDQQARNQLSGRFWFDDQVSAGGHTGVSFNRVVEKATNYTVVAADHGKLFMATTGAVTFTLPTKAVGLTFEFFQTTDNDLVLASAGSLDDILAFGDLAADLVTFSTATQKIGSHARVTCVYLGAALKWVFYNLGGTTATVT
jgi:hypothetical protein